MVKYFPPDLGQGLGKGRSAGDRSGSREGGMEWRRPRRFRSSSEVWVSSRKEYGGEHAVRKVSEVPAPPQGTQG